MVGGEDMMEEHGTQTPQNEEIFAFSVDEVCVPIVRFQISCLVKIDLVISLQIVQK